MTRHANKAELPPIPEGAVETMTPAPKWLEEYHLPLKIKCHQCGSPAGSPCPGGGYHSGRVWDSKVQSW